MEKPIILLGSSRKQGETQRAVEIAFGNEADCLDLQDYRFTFFDYFHNNQDDDFTKLIDVVLPRKLIVFATPVYWYAMSAQMKCFFDRLTDLVTFEKHKGRSLAGKTAWLVATGTDRELPDGFEVPFSGTCKYFGIKYEGACYLHTGKDEQLRKKTEHQMKEFGSQIISRLA